MLEDAVLTVEKGGPRSIPRSLAQRTARSGIEDVRRSHGAQVTNQVIEASIGDFNPVDIDDRRCKPGFRQEPSKSWRFDPRMDVRARLTGNGVGSEHRRAQPGQVLAARNGANQQPARFEDQVQSGRGKRKIVGGVKQADAQAKVELPGIERQSFQVCSLPAGLPRQQSARINDLNSPLGQALRP